jgi:hypothetical protein
VKIVVLDHEFQQMVDPLAKEDGRELRCGGRQIATSFFGERKKRFRDSSKKG